MDPKALRHPVLPLGRTGLRTLFSRILEDVLDKVNPGPGKWELRVTTDQPMARLHSLHLGGTGPTNVLAFPALTDGEKTGAGYSSIALNADAVMREAYLYGQDPTKHFIRLLTHAVLHLAGFDHGQVMEELTESVVQDLRNEGGSQCLKGIGKEEP